MTVNNHPKYDKDFKKSLVSLYQNGKNQSQLCQRLPICPRQMLKQYSTVEMDDGDVLTLCRVLPINRSTYYKHFRNTPAPSVSENQRIKSMILHIYADYDKRLGAYKVQYILKRDYGINISVGRMYRLMSCMELPKMSTAIPKSACHHTDNGEYSNLLPQRFSQDAPNLIWVSKADVSLAITVFQKAYKCRNSPYCLMFHSDRGIQYTAFAFRQLLVRIYFCCKNLAG